MVDITELENKCRSNGLLPMASVNKALLEDALKELKALRRTLDAVDKTLAKAFADEPLRETFQSIHDYNAVAREHWRTVFKVVEAEMKALRPKTET